MSRTRPSLEPWADLARLDPQGLALLRGPLPPQDHLETLVSVSARLPRGLLHAEAIHVHAEPPARPPLAPGSAWYAVERDLLVVVDPDRGAHLDGLLSDLSDYAALSMLVYRAAGEDPELGRAVASADAGPPTLRWVSALGTTDQKWRALDETAPGLRDELALMIQRPFEAPIHLHPHVRPGWLAAAGQEWADQLRARCPVERPWLIVSSGPETLELLSPYVRDLMMALGQWAVENPEQIRVPDLVDTWRVEPDEDLAGMVVPDLLKGRSDLVEERRANERTQGMFVDERAGVQAGYVELGRLSAPDRSAIPPGTETTALVAAGGPRALRVALVERWIQGGVAGVSAVFSAALNGSAPVAPKVLADDGDAFVLPGTDALIAQADELGVVLEAPEVLAVGGRKQSSASRLLGLLRRAQLCGDLDDRMPVYVVFVPRPSPGQPSTVAERRVGFEASRLVLRCMNPARSEKGPGPARMRKNPSQEIMPRRFRA